MVTWNWQIILLMLTIEIHLRCSFFKKSVVHTSPANLHMVREESNHRETPFPPFQQARLSLYYKLKLTEFDETYSKSRVKHADSGCLLGLQNYPS